MLYDTNKSFDYEIIKRLDVDNEVKIFGLMNFLKMIMMD